MFKLLTVILIFSSHTVLLVMEPPKITYSYNEKCEFYVRCVGWRTTTYTHFLSGLKAGEYEFIETRPYGNLKHNGWETKEEEIRAYEGEVAKKAFESISIRYANQKKNFDELKIGLKLQDSKKNNHEQN